MSQPFFALLKSKLKCVPFLSPRESIVRFSKHRVHDTDPGILKGRCNRHLLIRNTRDTVMRYCTQTGKVWFLGGQKSFRLSVPTRNEQKLPTVSAAKNELTDTGMIEFTCLCCPQTLRPHWNREILPEVIVIWSGAKLMSMGVTASIERGQLSWPIKLKVLQAFILSNNYKCMCTDIKWIIVFHIALGNIRNRPVSAIKSKTWPCTW